MEQHKLPKDSVGAYKYNNPVTFIENTKGVPKDKYFEAATDGIKGLVDKILNDLTKCKVKLAIPKADVKKTSLGAAALISSKTAAKITIHEDDQEEANRETVFRLACIVVKEGMVREITDRAGNNVTNPVLRHANRVRFKKWTNANCTNSST